MAKKQTKEGTWIEAMDLAAAGRALSAIDSAEGALEATSESGLPAIEGYVIDRRLGGGGGGEVYRAVRTGSDQPVAIKLLNKRLGETPEAKRAWRELDFLEQLRHPSIPRLLDQGVHDGRMYFATEYVDGHPLLEHCDVNQIDRAARVELLARIADAVQALHEFGVIHRDLKPSNILIDRHGRPMLVDLGIATLLSGDVMETLTVAGAPIGSPAFMAPEQARGEKSAVSTRSDVYGLGATAYVLLTGDTPHDMDATLHEAIRRVAQDPPRDPRELEPRLPKPLAAVLAKAVVQEPENRYASAAELAADLRRWHRGEPVEAGGLSIAQRVGRHIGHHPVAATAAACVLMALMTSAATLTWIQWLNAEPSRLEVDPNGPWVGLMSKGGKVIKDWNPGAGNRIVLSRIVTRPAEMGGGRVILLGFRHRPWSDPKVQLCALDLDEPEKVLWSKKHRAPDIEMPEPISTQKGDYFRLEITKVIEIFAQSPGAEILTVYALDRWSAAAVRIMGLDGSVLYELWHDGIIKDIRWLPREGLLIACGYNSEVLWRDREGHPQVQYMPRPIVIFAIRPELGKIYREWVRTPGGAGTVNPVWYRCLLPPLAVDSLVGGGEADFKLRTSTNEAASVDFGLGPEGERPPALIFSLDVTGRPVDVSPSDSYRIREGLPDPEVFWFGDLPPIDRLPPRDTVSTESP